MERKTNLTPYLWRAPHKPYDGKPIYANHELHEQLRWDELHALPKDEQRSRIWRCECGALVAWTTSKRTGKPYLCDVIREKTKRLGTFYTFYPGRPHFKTCEKG